MLENIFSCCKQGLILGPTKCPTRTRITENPMPRLFYGYGQDTALGRNLGHPNGEADTGGYRLTAWSKREEWAIGFLV